MVTNEEHRPKSHRAHLEWRPSRMVDWVLTIGPNTARLFERIMIRISLDRNRSALIRCTCSPGES
jgi:hypothetical protein